MPFTEGVPAQTALECLRFYMLEYHVDGFVVKSVLCAVGNAQRRSVIKRH